MAPRTRVNVCVVDSKERADPSAWEWGDMVVVRSEIGYRMSGVYMVGRVDGKNAVIDLGSSVDDYGNIPAEFSVPDNFTPDAIFGIDDTEHGYNWHNQFVPVDPSKFEYVKRAYIEEYASDGWIARYGNRTYALIDGIEEIEKASEIVYMGYVSDSIELTLENDDTKETIAVDYVLDINADF